MARVPYGGVRNVLKRAFYSLLNTTPRNGLFGMGMTVCTVGGGSYVLCKGTFIPKYSYCVESTEETSESREKAIQFSRDLIQRKKDEAGVPGIVVAVSVDGETLWAEGIGYADVENRVPCTTSTLMRIGSVSKSIAMTAVAKLWEEGKLDLDKPIQVYVPSFPEKTFQGKKVRLTLRHLLHHLGGIRHYKASMKNGNDNTKQDNTEKPDAEMEEFYMNRKFKTTEEALEVIKDDPLLSEPGSKYLYSTLGWILVAAAVEGASKESFPKYLNKVLKIIGMSSTYMDRNEPIIYNRARFYHRNKKGVLTNTPCVDNSYKWAGGGLLSSVNDLLLYGNSMLCSLQTDSLAPGFLKPSTVEAIWTPAPATSSLWEHWGKFAYGMGWVLPAQEYPCVGCKKEGPFVASHTGSSVGASSALIVLPMPCAKAIDKCRWKDAPRGVVVAIMGNMSSVAYGRIAQKIAFHFAELTK